MQEDAVVASVREALWVSLQVGGPLLLAILGVGLVISLLQALTQIQESALAFLPKLLVTGAALLLLGPFMVETLRHYTAGLFDRMITLGGAP
ncbi:flagellar biosynthetic protein FliQ [Acetobacteraceae bacterium H6797]|nr:flagellar biosynthetic protein FliQ [Acetobacteraceae bacterium H6797]